MMVKGKIYATPNRVTPNKPITFNPEICDGCNICVNICQVDAFIPNPEKKKPPIILYPDECWYCGSCVDACPKPGAIKFKFPLQERVRYKRKETGSSFRVK